MKKLYSLLLMVFAFAALQANAYNIYLRCDASDRVAYYGSMQWDEVVIPEGVTTVNCGDDEEAYICFFLTDAAAETYAIKSIVDQTTGEAVQMEWGQYNVALGSAFADHVFSITTCTIEETLSASMQVYVDKGENVEAYVSGTWRQVFFEDGWNEFRFNPDAEPMLMVNHSDWHYSLYKVVVDDVELELDGGYGYIDTRDGGKVEIYSEFPEGDTHISFSFENPGTEAAIGSVTVNGVEVENWIAGVDCKYGDAVNVDFLTDMYSIDKVTINDVEQDLWGYLSFQAAKDEYNICVTASTIPTFFVTIDVDRPDGVFVYRGSNDPLNRIELQPGENSVEVSSKTAKILVAARSMLTTINSVTLNGEDMEFSSWQNAYSASVKEGDRIEIRCSVAVRDKFAVVWVDDPSLAPYGCGMSRSDNSMWDDADGKLLAGYNDVNFADIENPFQLGFWGNNTFVVIGCDGNVVEPAYEGASYCDVTLENCGVVKAFLAGAPELKTVNFRVEEAYPGVYYDKILLHDDLSAPLMAYPGTEVIIKVVEATVTVDDEPVPNTDGYYIFTVSGNHDVLISGATGVGAISVDNAKSGMIYNLQGQMVGRDGDTSNLPAGLYLVGGKKTVVK